MAQSDPSIVEALDRAHAALGAALRKLEVACAGSEPSLGELNTRLGDTYQHVIEHFHFEEVDGFMAAVRDREPRLERAVQQLSEEHRQLAGGLETLLGEARAAPWPDEALRERIRAWIGRLRSHEVRENRVVQEAFDLDLDAGD